MKEELNDILNKLVELGEDKDELEYWRDIFPNLREEKQKELFELFKLELKQLSDLQ
jgi:hypothetical protein